MSGRAQIGDDDRVIVLETARLTVRTFAAPDLPELDRIYRTSVARRCVGTGEPHGRERAELAIRRATEHGPYAYGTWAVVDRSSGAIVGECGLRELEAGPSVEVDCLIDSAYRGRGIATELVDALLGHGFARLGVERIVAVARPDDLASVRLMEKLAMRFAREGSFYGRDCLLYEIDRTEWGASHPDVTEEADAPEDDED